MGKKAAILSAIFFLIFLLLSSKIVSADYKEVLAVSSGPAPLQVPATVEGPGFILPDSPLFFLDQLKQNVRLLLAFTPEAKAKVHAAVAGERLAELRVELAKNNLTAAKIALDGISENLTQASSEVSQAKLTGRDIAALAQQINNDIKNKQQALDVLEAQAKGELKARVGAVQTSLLQSKLKVEDNLPEKDLENEIRDDLNRAAAEKVEEASDSAREIQADVEELQKEASLSAQNSLSTRQKALQKAIEEKNEVLKKVEEKLLQKEQEKQGKLLEVQNKAAEAAKEAVAKAQEAALKFQQIQQIVNQIRNQAVTVTENSGGSANSGSSNSGSSGGGDNGGSSSKGDDHGGKNGKD